MKKILVTLLFANALAISTHASVSISFGMGTMYGSTNTALTFPAGGRLNLLALDSGSWSTAYPSLISSLQSLTNSWTLPGTTLVGAIANDNAGGSGSTTGQFDFSYSGGFTAGDELLLVAYPTLTLSSSAPGLGTPGFFFRTASVIDGSSIAWVAPADGNFESLYAYTLGESGSLPNGQFTSGTGAAGGQGFTTVPEPSTYALLAMSGIGMAGYVIRRRRRA